MCLTGAKLGAPDTGLTSYAEMVDTSALRETSIGPMCPTGAKLGAPDTGLISYAEMVDQGRYIHEATRSMPIIGDGDTGVTRE